MGYCSIHGEFSRPEHWGCPECQAAQETAEAANANIEEALSALIEESREKAEREREISAKREENERAAAAKREENDARVIAALNAINNPGDYACPACKLFTLIRGAARCPRCQQDIAPAFWEEIRRKEEIERERKAREAAERAARAAEEKKKEAAERAAKQAAAEEKARVLEIQEKKKAAERAAEQAAVEEKERIKTRRTLRILGIGAAVTFLLGLGADKILTVIRINEFEKAIANKQTFQAQDMARRLGPRYATADGLRDLNEYDASKRRFQEEGGANRDLIEKFGGDELAAVQDLVKKAEESSDPCSGSEFYEQARKQILVVQTRLNDLVSARQTVEKLSGGTASVTAAQMQKYAPQELGAAQQAVRKAEVAPTPEEAVAVYRTAAVFFGAAIEKASVPAKLTITCNVPEFGVFENNQKLTSSNQQFSLAPFTEHILEVRAPGYGKVVLNVRADEPGKILESRPVVLQKCPQAGRNWTAQLGGGVTMTFVTIPSGSFQMGSGNGGDDEKPVCRVTISKPFWMAKTEVTQAQYQQVMGVNPSYFKGSQNPVEQVSWNDAMEFCRKLTAQEQQAGRLPEGWEYTLPTEAQWEYACRAGTSGDYAGSLNMMGWYDENSGRTTHPVGIKQPNAWDGLHDMHGNVYEWCSDWYGSYPSGNVTDPCGPASGSDKACRGGDYNNRGDTCRSASRARCSPGLMGNTLGFRPVLSATTAEILTISGSLEGLFVKAPPAVTLSPNWKGVCIQSGYDPYPMLLQIDFQNGTEIGGRIRWPTLGDTITRFRGRVENGYIALTEYECIQGRGAAVPTEYEAVLKGSIIEGTCRTKRLLSTVTASFHLEPYQGTSLVDAPSQTPKYSSSNWQPAPSTWDSRNKPVAQPNSNWKPPPSSWGSQNAPVAQPNKPSNKSSGRTAW